MEFALVANPENRRARFFQAAALAQGHRVRLVSWLDALAGRGDLRADALRFDSPGENWDVTRAFTLRGGGSAPVREDRGRVTDLRPWLSGFSRTVGELEARAGRAGLNPAADILSMFDKPRSQRHLQAAGVPVPPMLGPAASTPSNLCELNAAMATAGWDKAFVKLAHGSSASGVIAYSRGPRRAAWTSLVRDGEHFYNHLQVRRYGREEEIREVIDFVLSQGAQVERWVRKARYGSRPLDLRVLVVDGEPSHWVVRLGRSPMTNLHLGTGRGDREWFAKRAGPDGMARVWEVSRAAAAAYPACLSVAVDVLIESDFSGCQVCEVNAFGDLLPGITDRQGDDTYGAQVRAAARRQLAHAC